MTKQTKALGRATTVGKVSGKAAGKVPGKVVGKLGRVAGRLVSIVDLIGMLGDLMETYRILAREKTKRVQIAAQLQTTLAEIAARQALAMEYLAGRFAERRQVIEICREIITKAQDRDLVLQAMETLQVIVITSPFDNLTAMLPSTGTEDQ